MKKYLEELEIWLKKWRLSIAANKCSFTIYATRIPKELNNGTFKLMINGSEIPINHEPRYLGVILDRNLNMNTHTDTIRTKCIKALNILKCLTYKTWSMKEENQIRIYKSLIRSKLEYAAPVMIMSINNIQRLSGIQYQALKIIYKEKIECSNQYLHDLSQIQRIEDRLFQLSSNYLQKAITESNPLIIQLISEITYSSGTTKTPIESIGF